MKFARLYLKAFGPFRNRVIEVPTDPGTNFHIVFGPNEAGKSTTLRAVTGFLFGIPERTGDAFLHDYKALRVGATLVFEDGRRLSVMRRKGRIATLFAIDERSGTEITDRSRPENSLADVLGGLDQALYQSLFGLDLAGLVEGSEELLRGEGEVGRSLFQAAAGLASLRNLIAGLDDDATAIFKPRGSTSSLNRALSEYDEQKRALKEATVRSSAWEAAEREHRQAEGKLGQQREALKGKRTEQQRLQRIHANLPLVAERAVKQGELEQLGAVPALPPDAAQRRAAVQERLRGAEESTNAARTQLQNLKLELEHLTVRRAVLEQASAIEQAFHGVAGYRTARDAVPRLNSERAVLSDRIRRLLAQIDSACPLERAASLLPEETLAARVQALIDDHLRLTTLREQLDTQTRAKNVALERLSTRLASLPQPAAVQALEKSLASFGNAGDLEERLGKLDRASADLDGELQREAAALWPGSLLDLVVLTVPLPGTVADFEGEFTGLAQDERLLADRVSTLTRDLEERGRELKALAATGEVVTQTEVAAARGERDSRWSRIRRTYLGQSAPDVGTPPEGNTPQLLAEALDEAIKEADRLADLLHADVQRATNLETTRQRIADMQTEMRSIEAQRAELSGKRDDLRRRWEALMGPLRRPELTPGALREWLSRHQRAVEKHNDLTAQRNERDAVASDLTRARAALNGALVACGLAGCTAEETTAGLLARARQAVSAATKARADRESIETQIEEAKFDLRDLQAQQKQHASKFSEWGRNWSDAVGRLNLPGNALPDEAKVRLDQLSRLATALEDLEDLDHDTNTQAASATNFEAQITGIAGAVEEHAPGLSADALAERLYATLREARGAETKRQQLVNDTERETRTLAQAESTLEQAQAQLEELVRQAGCTTADQLPEVEGRAERKQTLRHRLVEIEEQIVKQNARPIGEVAQEAEGFDLDGLARRIGDLAAEIEDMEENVEAAQAERFAAKQRFDAIDGGPAAAEAQQALMSLSARIAKESRAYARARLAGAVLSRVVQTYRDRHQGPILRRAGDIFARVTLGSFAGLTVDYEDDQQVLLGVRPDGDRVGVSGLSQGTRDQLFLSLRLAAVEQHLEGRGPMPVIIDDLLVQFDDDRARAALEVLAELSKRTQILFFTHHRHLVEIAKGSKVGPAISILGL